MQDNDFFEPEGQIRWWLYTVIYSGFVDNRFRYYLYRYKYIIFASMISNHYVLYKYRRMCDINHENIDRSLTSSSYSVDACWRHWNMQIHLFVIQQIFGLTFIERVFQSYSQQHQSFRNTPGVNFSFSKRILQTPEPVVCLEICNFKLVSN